MRTPPSTEAIALGKILKKQRNELHLTQHQLAQHCNFDRTFISQLERGVREPSLKHLRVLAKSMQCQPSDLLNQAELSQHDDGSTAESDPSVNSLVSAAS